MKKPVVLLIHGLYMHPLVMRYLEKQFIKAGHNVLNYGYRTTKLDIRELQRLTKELEALAGQKVVLVGHSLGGLVCRKLVHHLEQHKRSDILTNIHAILTLGTPHNTAKIAHIVKPIGILGEAADAGLTKVLPAWKSSIPLGSIAGNLSLGPLALLHRLSGVTDMCDGTVTVKETQLKNMRDHVVLPVSHTGLVYSKQVVAQCLHFIDHFEFFGSK